MVTQPEKPLRTHAANLDHREEPSPFSVGATSRESNSHDFKAPKTKNGRKDKDLRKQPKKPAKELKLIREAS